MFGIHYDTSAARETLKLATENSIAEMAKEDDAASQHINTLKVDKLKVQVTGTNRKIWRVGPANDEGSVEDELVFRAQGILTKVNLTPGNLERATATKVANLSQQVTISGADGETFEIGLQNLQGLQEVFNRYFHTHSEGKWSGTGDGAKEINASNRYLTSLRDEPTAVHVNFAYGVDPLQSLEPFLGNGMVHSVDNVVSYFVKNVDKKGEAEYEIAYPGTFKVGDVVEIQASMMAFQSTQNISTHCNLRALTLLDDKHSKAAQVIREAETANRRRSVVTLRRRIGYPDKAHKVARTG